MESSAPGVKAVQRAGEESWVTNVHKIALGSHVPQAASTVQASQRIGSYLSDMQDELKTLKEQNRRPELSVECAAFLKLIEDDLSLRFLASQMIHQVPSKYSHDPTGGPRIKSIRQMIRLIDLAIRKPPPFNKSELVGFPINAILDWCMGTSAGAVFFLNEKVNAALKNILNAWTRYLESPSSLSAFAKDQWMSPLATSKINIAEYIHDPNAPAWGFKSWNDFFIRKFKPGVRPIGEPENDLVIVSACESTPYAIQQKVQRSDTFWIKTQPYSLKHLLNGKHVDDFVNGTVYQAFLSAFNYHRWHAPVSGRIMHVEVVEGSYYAEAPSIGFDPSGPNLSQGYIAHTAARGLIFIDAPQPIGLMAVVTIGMAEVSSNVITVKKGDYVKKGDEIGYFQFGGSTHCLVFQEGVIDSFDIEAIPGPRVDVVPLGTRIATARQKNRQ